MINQLRHKILDNKIDYQFIKSNAIINLLNEEEFDVNIIIGCRGRKNFSTPLIESFENAIKNVPNKKITITFVDHNTFPEHMKLVKGRANYIWTEGNVSDQYSRSFAYNFGVKFGNKAKFYLLHDLDILVKDNFFVELFENLGEQKCIQPYGGRRVLYMSESLTKKVIEKEIDFNSFSQESYDVSLPMFNGQPALGSKGGSIFIEKELFEEVGGFDPELFWGYAAEDQFFWEKVNNVSQVGFADSPLIDMFHMWHPPSYTTNPLLHSMEGDWIVFKDLNAEEKMEIIKLKKELYAE
jgi:hypothetical protein